MAPPVEESLFNISTTISLTYFYDICERALLNALIAIDKT